MHPLFVYDLHNRKLPCMESKNKNKTQRLTDLPIAERIETLQNICAYLTDKLCESLYGDMETSLNFDTGVTSRNILNKR